MGCEYYSYYKYYSQNEAHDKWLIAYILYLFEEEKEEDIGHAICNTL